MARSRTLTRDPLGGSCNPGWRDEQTCRSHEREHASQVIRVLGMKEILDAKAQVAEVDAGV